MKNSVQNHDRLHFRDLNKRGKFVAGIALGSTVAFGAAAPIHDLIIKPIVKAVETTRDQAEHITNPSSIPPRQATYFKVPTGGNPSSIAKELAPESRSDQSSISLELQNESKDGVLPAGELVEVDSAFVETHPADIEFVTVQQASDTPATK